MIKQKILSLGLSNKKRNEKGMVLIAFVFATIAFSIIAVAVLGAATSEYSLSKQQTFSANAMLSAEAGIEQTIQQLNVSDTFGGYTSEQTFFDSTAQGKGVYTTTIADHPSDSNAKVITSTGKVYRYGTSEVISQRLVKVTAVGTGSQGYSVHTGPGGLILGGSANITNSDVYVNGTITLTGSAKIGTASQPVNVFAANYVCPSGNSPGPTYPSLCSSGQPISLAHSTAIYGTVCATGQTSTGPNNNIKTGNGGSGLVAGCVAPQVSTPTYDKPAQVAAVTTTASGTSNTYVCAQWPFDRTWIQNLKLTGNVSVAGSCNVKIKGNVYITGDLTLGGAAKITVDESVGTTRPVVLVDGKITVGGSAQLLANSFGTGIEFISWKSTASCNPNCTSLSGNDLKTSSGTETVNVGGGVNMPGMIFDAHWGKITVGGSGNVGAAIGQTVDMSGAGTVTFGTTLSSGARTWTITSYQQVYD